MLTGCVRCIATTSPCCRSPPRLSLYSCGLHEQLLGYFVCDLVIVDPPSWQMSDNLTLAPQTGISDRNLGVVFLWAPVPGLIITAHKALIKAITRVPPA